jgi:PmbA protein
MKDLISLAKVSKENPQYGGVAKGKFQYQKGRADKALQDLEDPAGYVVEAIDAAKKEAGPRTNAGGILFTKFEDVYLASSEGPMGQDSRSAVEFSIRAFSQKEASGHGVQCGSTIRGFDPAKAGAKAGE